MKPNTRQLINALMEAGHHPDVLIEREMLQEATAVFGSQDGAEDWLVTPCMALNQERPIDLIARGDADEVRVLLVRLAHGVYT